ncbi:hypothetical protein PHLCEN_2v6712, partial [Hermanssonia centrifuga]
ALRLGYIISKLTARLVNHRLNTRDYILGTLSGPNSTQSNSIPLSNLSKEGSGPRPVNVVVTHSLDTVRLASLQLSSLVGSLVGSWTWQVNAGIISKPSYGFDV